MMSDLLKCTYSIENETAQKAIKDFAAILQEALMQYQTLWDEHIELLNKIQDINIKHTTTNVKQQSTSNEGNTLIPAQMFINFQKNNTEPTSKECHKDKEINVKTMEKHENIVDHKTEDISNVNIFDTELDIEENTLKQNTLSAKEMKSDILPTSPILHRKRCKSKRQVLSPSCKSILDSSTSSSDDVINTSFIRTDSYKRKVVSPVSLQILNNSTSIAKCNDKCESQNTCNTKNVNLNINKLYNINTTCLPSGKKLKQTKLQLMSTKNNSEETSFKICSDNDVQKDDCNSINIKQHSENFSKKDCSDVVPLVENIEIPPKNTFSDNKISTNYHNTSLCEDVVQVTPTCERSSLSFNKLLKLKSKSSKMISLIKSSSKENLHAPSTSNNSVINYPFSVYTSGKEQLPRTARINSCSTDRTKTKNVHTSIIKDQPTEVQLAHLHSSYDETFFAVEENEVKSENKNVLEITDFKDNFEEMLFEDDLHISPPAKKILLDNSNIMSQENKRKVSSNCENRATEYTLKEKSNGQDCWECRQYYKNLGLTKEELKLRKNQCSRHRTKYDQIQATPADFWDPVFPDTSRMSQDW